MEQTKQKTGLTHLYFGDGKGKTTAALGLALRASGQGERVVIVQFLKNTPCGELNALQRLEHVRVLRGQAGTRFSFAMSDEEKRETERIHNENLKTAISLAQNGECDLLILDEALDALQLDLLDGALFYGLLEQKPDALELVVTGHALDERTLAAADYATRMEKCKHPYDRGVKARRGVEF